MFKQLKNTALQLFGAIFFVACSFFVRAQDPHLSQFWLSPTSINPSAAGFFEGDARVGTYYRTQWKAITQPYQSSGVFSDFALKRRPRQQDIFGMGITFDFDQAGDSKYRSVQGNIMLSYAKALNSMNNHFLMIGVSAGGVQRSWDYSQLMFDEQYQNGIYDPTIPLSELFPTKSFWFLDCSVGIQWFYQPKLERNYQIGISVSHLNRPHISLYKEDNIQLPIKTILSTSATFVVKGNVELTPTVFYTIQGNYQELILGLQYAYCFRFDYKWYLNKINFGAYFRWKDALYLTVGGEWRRIKLGISYDINLSKLSKASHSRGSFEINLSYIIKKYHVPKQKSIPCYLF